MAHWKKDPDGKELVFPDGVIVNLDPTNIVVSPFDPDKITESVKYGWYKDKKTCTSL